MRCLVLAIAMLLASSPVWGAFYQEAPFTVVCSLWSKLGERMQDRTFTFNEAEGTITNGWARFTPEQIEWWQGSGEKKQFHYVLNRLSGQISVSSDRFPNLMTGTCIKATGRKF